MTTIRITRNLVSTNEAMEGKKVRTLDGELRAITGCPSGTSYSVEGTRARVYAYLIVKDGRNFKEIEPADIEGKVVAAEDMGGYAKYTMAGKRAPAKADTKPAPKNPKADTKPAPKAPAKQPKAAPKADAKAPKSSGTAKRTPKAQQAAENANVHKVIKEVAGKSAGKGAKVQRVQHSELEQSILNAGTIAKPAGKILRDALSAYVHDALLASPEFAGLYEVTSESLVGDDGSVVEVKLQIDMAQYFGRNEEPEAPEVDVDAAFEALLGEGYTAKQLRPLSDEELIDLYNATFEGEGEGEEEPEQEEEEPTEFEEEQEEEQEEEEGEELMQMHLPSTIFNGVKQLPAGDELDAAYVALAEGLGVDEVWAGVVLQQVADESYWVFAGIAANKQDEPRALLTAFEAVEDEDEEAARKSRKLVSIGLLTTNYQVVAAPEAEEGEEEEQEEEYEEEELEEVEETDELQMDFDA